MSPSEIEAAANRKMQQRRKKREARKRQRVERKRQVEPRYTRSRLLRKPTKHSPPPAVAELPAFTIVQSEEAIAVACGDVADKIATGSVDEYIVVDVKFTLSSSVDQIAWVVMATSDKATVLVDLAGLSTLPMSLEAQILRNRGIQKVDTMATMFVVSI